MKRFQAAILALLATATLAQSQEQSGVAAKMVAVNGKEYPVFLQSLEDGKLVFQMYKSSKNQGPLDASKIASFNFLGTFDADGAKELFNSGDYQGMISKIEAELAPSLDEYWQYMVVDNNYQDMFCMLMEAYLKLGDDARASQASSLLLQSKNPSVHARGLTVAILVALGEGEIAAAEGMLGQIKSAAGKLYIRACIEAAKEQPKEAIQLVTQLIADYGNDLDWMPRAELLNAHLYMDLGLTNSAILTARQVKNIYAHSDISADAAKLQKDITAAKEKAEAEAKAKADAEAAARAEVKARAEERANIGVDDEEGSSVEGEGDANDQPGNATDTGSQPESDL